MEFSVCGRYSLVANNREAMQDMMSTFLVERKLELCADKTKILVFNRKKKERKEIWKWRDKRIEEVQTFKYLGFILNNKDNYKEHIKELCGKGRRAVRKVWGLVKDYAGTTLGEDGFYLGI